MEFNVKRKLKANALYGAHKAHGREKGFLLNIISGTL